MVIVTSEELNKLLDECLAKQDLQNSHTEFSKLRTWGRDSGFCVNIVNKDSFNKIIKILTKLGDQDCEISLLATISNIMLANRDITEVLLQFDLNELVNNTAIALIDDISSKKSYNDNLTASILPPLRFIYLITVDKTLVKTLSRDSLQHIVQLVSREFKLLGDGDIALNSLVLVDTIKIAYSLLHFDHNLFDLKAIELSLHLCGSKKISKDILCQFANYFSFLPLEELYEFDTALIKISQSYKQILFKTVADCQERNATISVLNFFNHMASLSESLYREKKPILFKNLRTNFIPQDEVVPSIYTELMRVLLGRNTQNNLFGSKNTDDIIKNLTLDFYFKIMGNNIEFFMNEIGLLLTMDFVKLKQGQNLKMFAQEDIAKMKPNTGMYPLHYNVVEENKKKFESLPEMTEAEKEEEWEKLMDTFDKMKKNGMIKMVDNPMDAFD